ncbi:MAG: RDD family protein [Rhizobiaceae bacterium]
MNLIRQFSYRTWFYGAVFLVLLFLPYGAEISLQRNLISFTSLIMIFSIAVVSLNLILGFGGMISFGHAAYLAIGGYSVGIAAYHGVTNGFAHIVLAVVFSALFALVTGAISLRTKGVHFIMITLAFAQMLFYGMIGLEKYGADDGLMVNQRSDFLPLLDLENNNVLYYTIFACLLLSIYIVYRIVNSRFGRVIEGTRSNEPRMIALGFATYQYKLACYVIAGVMCGIAGMLFANYANFVNPEDTAWTTSGELIFMVVLGGLGSMFGAVLGAITFFMMAEYLSRIPIVGTYWQIYFGPFLILVVLYARGGIDGWLVKFKMREDVTVKGLTVAPAVKRIAAMVIDAALLIFISWLVIGVIGLQLLEFPKTEFHQHLVMVLCSYFLIGWVIFNHFFLPASKWRGSFGKQIMGLSIISADGQTMSPTQAVHRAFGQGLSLATGMIGYFLFMKNAHGKALHDNLAATLVINNRQNNAMVADHG